MRLVGATRAAATANPMTPAHSTPSMMYAEYRSSMDKATVPKAVPMTAKAPSADATVPSPSAWIATSLSTCVAFKVTRTQRKTTVPSCRRKMSAAHQS